MENTTVEQIAATKVMENTIVEQTAAIKVTENIIARVMDKSVFVKIGETR